MRDFLIVGGGVIGLSLAWELSRRKKSVCVVDGGSSERQTSWVGAGIFPPPLVHARHDPLEQLRARGHELHFEWAERLKAETGIDNELRRCGGIYVARSPGEGASLRIAMQQAQEDGVVTEALAAADVVKLEPNLATMSSEIREAFRLPEEMQIRSPRQLDALRAACTQQGVEFRLGQQVTELRDSAGHIEARTPMGPIPAEQICLCGGPWTPHLLERLNVSLPIEPWRGQLILWKTPEPLLSHVVNEGLRYLVPRRDGHLLVGATVEDVGFDCQTTDEAVESLRTFACEFLPELKGLVIKQAWAGLRPGTPDGRPYLGRVPGTTNLAVAAGHYRSGLHLSAVTAVFMSQLLLDDTPEMDLHPFRIER